MARDNSPKDRQQKQLERKQGRRASYDRILIVSEGSKTEPNYFREIRATHRLHTTNVEVQPRSLSDLGNIGYEPTAAVHFSPFSCPIGGTMGLSKRQKLSSLGSILAINA